MNPLQQLEHLRTRFASTERFDWEPEWPAPETSQRAGVLIALQDGPQGLELLLTRRTDHLYHHPGQISFPGGRMEEHDADETAAALREAEEEIGLPVNQVEIIGSLPDYITSSAFRVSPVVGYVNRTFTPQLDAFEVAELFSVPLQHVINPSALQRHRVNRGATQRHFFALPYDGRFIWGATAGMLAMLAAFLR